MAAPISTRDNCLRQYGHVEHNLQVVAFKDRRNADDVEPMSIS